MDPTSEQVDSIFRDPSDINYVLIALTIVVAVALVWAVQKLLPWAAEKVPPRFRFYILPWVPTLRILIIAVAVIQIVPSVLKPTTESLITILGAAGIAIGFAFRDYVSSLIAGVVATYERPYRPGDWIEVDGAYGEVRSLGLRAVRIVTPDDTVVTIPHSKMWGVNIYNSNNGQETHLCVADFYLEPQHDARMVREKLRDVALTSPYLNVERPVNIIVAAKPWGTHYRVKAYPVESHQQFQFISDLTVKGQEALMGLGVGFATMPFGNAQYAANS